LFVLLLPILVGTIVLIHISPAGGVNGTSVKCPYHDYCKEPTVTDPNLKVEKVYQGNFKFEPNNVAPVSSMAFLGNDLLILNKNNGTVYKIVNGSITSGPLLDVNVANKRERGLLGIAVSKNSNVGNYIFLYYSESQNKDGSDVCPEEYYCKPGTEPIGNRLYRYELHGNKLTNPKLLLDLPVTPGPAHNGGALQIGPDNNIYVTLGDLLGDYNKSSSTKAQNIQNGTNPDGRAGILRVTQDGYTVGRGILGKYDPLNKYYAYGIRNSFGIGFDPVTGNLWDTENGPLYGDEINLVKPGFNGGWMVVQGIWKPVNSNIDDFSRGDELLNPTNQLVDFNGKGYYGTPQFVWKHTVGPTAIKFLTSDRLGKKYQNDLFVGCVNLGVIFHFDLNKDRTKLILNGTLKDRVADNNNEELQDIIFASGLGRITDIEIGPDGYMYVLSAYEDKATIFRIVPEAQKE
jgi:aldose sugar dehydrogenase